VRLRGRVASLLEVGTGFHPELTGRENIFLNGAILGMSKAEIRRKFDEIVAFAEVEKFLDTPVKRYSSGMYVRLAFAVAAHLEPEILLVDEVLAVGDAQFQKKCLGKMEDVATNEGRTVLFVSHQMAAIEKLCTRCALLYRGQLQYVGSPSQAISHYLISASNNSTLLSDRLDRQGSGEVRVHSIDIKDDDGNILDVAASGQSINICLNFEKRSQAEINRVIASIMIKTQLDVPVFLQHNRLTQSEFGNLPKQGSIVCNIPKLPLPPTSYKITYSLIRDGQYLDGLQDAFDFLVIAGNFYGSGEVTPSSHSTCLVDGTWNLQASSRMVFTH
jgi:lipopolysaccharide transport system ATP-binding protein